jgi:KUP system potassium uptake protein
VIENPPIRLPGAAAIFTASGSGIPLALTHHLRHNRVLHERILLVSTVSTDAPRVDPAERVKLMPVGAGITRVTLLFGFMEHPSVMEGLRLACRDPTLSGIDPEQITYYFRRVMVVTSGKVPLSSTCSPAGSSAGQQPTGCIGTWLSPLCATP